MTMNRKADTAHECIEPIIGDQIWRLEAGNLDPELHRKLTAHLQACQHCQEIVDLDSEARSLMREGLLKVPKETAPRRESRRWRWRGLGFSGFAAAACLLLTILLPPRPAGITVLHRGDDSPRFTSPVEGEVVSNRFRELRWTALHGVTSYRIRLVDESGNQVWEGDSREPKLELPESMDLGENSTYQARLSVQPADLLSQGKTTVRFSTGSIARITLHRIRWARRWIQVLGIVSLSLSFLLAVGIVRLRA